MVTPWMASGSLTKCHVVSLQSNAELAHRGIRRRKPEKTCFPPARYVPLSVHLSARGAGKPGCSCCAVNYLPFRLYFVKISIIDLNLWAEKLGVLLFFMGILLAGLPSLKTPRMGGGTCIRSPRRTSSAIGHRNWECMLKQRPSQSEGLVNTSTLHIIAGSQTSNFEFRMRQANR